LLFTYAPLFRTLDRQNKKLIDIVRECGLSTGTVAKFRKNEVVKIDIIARLCRYLNVHISDVVEVVFD
jgi:putative transcriptional regulator